MIDFIFLQPGWVCALQGQAV